MIRIAGAFMLLFACSKGKTIGPGSGSGSGSGNGSGSAVVEVLETCDTDADCVVDCTRRDECCDTLCRCETAHSKRAAAAIHDENTEHCRGRAIRCATMSCPAPTDDVVARCRAHRCATEHVAHAEQIDGMWTAAGAPPPKACAADADCTADSASARDLCCNNPYGVVAQSAAWRRWIMEWRERTCKGHACPPPPSPPPPLACELAVKCVDQKCANTCAAP